MLVNHPLPTRTRSFFKGLMQPHGRRAAKALSVAHTKKLVTGLEPATSRFTKPLLLPLSYTSTKQEVGCHRLPGER